VRVISSRSDLALVDALPISPRSAAPVAAAARTVVTAEDDDGDDDPEEKAEGEAAPGTRQGARRLDGDVEPTRTLSRSGRGFPFGLLFWIVIAIIIFSRNNRPRRRRYWGGGPRRDRKSVD